MKCEKCGKEMNLYKHAMHLHYEEKRWRCGCGYEFVEPFAQEIPEKYDKIDKKK